MKFDLTEEQELVRRTARDFAARELAGAAAARDAQSIFPEAELRALGDIGLLGVNVPEQFGGSEAGVVAYSLAMQELARVDASVSVHVSVTNMVGELICAVGTEEQKRAHVPLLVSGEAVCGAFALSEPQAGSDPAAMLTTATKVDGGWRISGTKQWITGGDRAGVTILWAITDKAAKHRGISAFIIGGDVDGLSVSEAEKKLGLCGSSTVQLSLDNVEVPDDALLGGEGAGFKLAMMALDGGRIGIASQAVGIARGAVAAALRYAGERETFGKPILQHQAVAFMLADSATWIDAAELMALRAAYLKEAGKPFSREAAMAKLFASEHAVKACDHALQIHGGNGYTKDFPVERAYRDVRVTKIYEGTSEIQRLVIARQLMKDAGL